MSIARSFSRRKETILEALSVPADEYDDLSPKGSIDVGIIDLIDEINKLDGLVTTSSCAGRISVFLEGIKKDDRNQPQGSQDSLFEAPAGLANLAAAGGKGGGGKWLFASHDRVPLPEDGDTGVPRLFGFNDVSVPQEVQPSPRARLIHFKFEPMILHILAASPEYAQMVLTAGVGAGFRESGALNLLSSSSEPGAVPTPMVAIRTAGLALQSIIGIQDEVTGGYVLCVSPAMLGGLLQIANRRFDENEKRIARFRGLLTQAVKERNAPAQPRLNADGKEWEDSDTRRARKRVEGLLLRASALKEPATAIAAQD